jgi:DNA-binding response OmpR family regulator
LLLDPEMDRAAKLAAQLEQIGSPTRTESTGTGALAAIKGAYFATLIVIADLDNEGCLDWLDDLRRAATRVWMIVVSPRCDPKTCNLIYRHGGDACLTAPASVDDLNKRLTAFQSRVLNMNGLAQACGIFTLERSIAELVFFRIQRHANRDKISTNTFYLS